MTLFGYDLGYVFGQPAQGATEAELVEYRELVAKWTGAFFLAGLLVVLAYGSGVVVALVWALACFAVGAAAGFVFGVPKSGSTAGARRPASVPPTTQPAPTQPAPQPTLPTTLPPVAPAPAPVGPVGAASPAPAAPAQDGPRFAVNTNLEEISDWATKLIVGLTLVQFREVTAYFRDAAALFAAGLGNTDPQKHLAFAQGAMVYFSVIGFLGSYLITRLLLAAALRLAETSDLARLEAAVRSAATSAELVGRRLEETQRTIGAAIHAAPAAEVARLETTVQKIDEKLDHVVAAVDSLSKKKDE